MSIEKREFGESFIYTATNYFFWFLMGNVYFAICNIPLILIMLAMIGNGKGAADQSISVIGCISCISLGPASAALYSSMGKLVRDKDVNITRDFFKAYKVNFLQALFFSALEIIILVALYTDIKLVIYKGIPSILGLLLYVAIVFIILVGLYIFPIQSRFYMKSRDIIKFSVYYTFRRFNITIINLAVLAVIGFIFLRVFPLIIVFIPSIFCYLIMFNEQKVLSEIEENLKKSDESISLE